MDTSYITGGDLVSDGNMAAGLDSGSLPKFKERLLEGDKVRLNVAKMKSRSEYNNLQRAYRDFVESNANITFTVEYDTHGKNKPNVVCLKEDKREVKWLFWDGDLLVLDGRDGKFKELHMIVDDGNR